MHDGVLGVLTMSLYVT